MKYADKKKPRQRQKGRAAKTRQSAPENGLSPIPQLDTSVIDASPVGLVGIDNHGHVTRINSAALEIFDLNRDSVTTVGSRGKPSLFIDLMPEKERARWQYIINMVLSTRDSYANDRFFHHTGYVEKVLAVKISTTLAGDSAFEGLIMVVEDITNTVLMEKYLILSEKLAAKGELAGSIAHELRGNIEAALKSADQLPLYIDRKQIDKAKTNCAVISESISAMQNYIYNLVDISKPQTEYISYDIKQLIEDLLFSLKMQPRFKQIHFTIDLSAEIPSLEMDVGQIQQVLTNVLNNAADAIEDRAIEHQKEGCELKREIEIRADYDKMTDIILVEITDNGVGMSQETLDKAFDMHFSTKKSGHGLGLYNCRKIIEQHHGDIMAQSTYGEGSTFFITLPRLQPRRKK